MNIETALATYLAAHAPLVALIGDRVYPARLPQGAVFPALTYTKVSNPRNHLIAAAAPRFQLSCWATTYDGAKALAKVVRKAIYGYHAPMGGAGGVTVEQGVYLDEHDDYTLLAPTDSGQGAGIHHIPVDVKLICREE